MSIKSAVKYQFIEMKKAVMVYYAVIYAIYILLIVSLGLYVSGEVDGNSIGGMEFSTVIFIFILGLNSFKESFRMFLQNGLSRKTLFKSFILSATFVSIFMAFVDIVNGIVVNIISNYKSMYLQVYGGRYSETTSLATIYLEGFFWSVFLYIAFAMLGYFITILYYRMNKQLQIIVSIGVPVFWIILFPLIDYNLAKGALSLGIKNFIIFTTGFKNGINPYYFITSSIIGTIILGILSYILMQKAVGKKQ